jgi:hypothetical protein
VRTFDTYHNPHSHFLFLCSLREQRLSYHGYPKGYAQLLMSPNQFQITPMQIDAWNRDAGSSPKFVPGPLPKVSPAPREGDDAIYSGLLECPCSDRLERKIWNHYQLLPATQSMHNCHSSVTAAAVAADTATCEEKDKLNNATECFAAGQYVLPSPNEAVHHTVEPYNPNMSEGCSLIVRSDGIVDIYWNEKKKKNSDDEDALPRDNESQIQDEKETVHQDKKRQEVVAFASSTLNATVTLTSWSTDVSDDSIGSNETNNEDKAVLTLVGPKDVWFGIGWGTNNMCREKMIADVCPGTGPYSIIVIGDHVEERLLGYHGIGEVLASSTPYMSVISNTVDGEYRTVKIERPLEGFDERYFSFNINASSVDVIMAKGCSMTLAQHCGHGSAKLNFLATNTRRTVCGDGELASIGGRVFQEGKRCAPFPKSTLVQQHNPTCSIRTYLGGQHCCHHMVSLLDKDHEIPWDDQPLEYHLKFRFYFEEYVPPKPVEENKKTLSKSLSPAIVEPASHQNLVRLYWMTEAYAGEYDVMKCPNGTPSDQCVHMITSQWNVQDMLSDCDGGWCTGRGSTKADGIELIYAAPHCHAPSCLSVELYNADTGELLCHVEPRPGKSTDKVHDELGFLAIPPCMWGNKEDGLVEPVFLPLNTTLYSIKRNNNTLTHFGEMASWQMRGIVVSKPGEHSNNEVENESAEEYLMEDETQKHFRNEDASFSASEEEERTLKIRRRGNPAA